MLRRIWRVDSMWQAEKLEIVHRKLDVPRLVRGIHSCFYQEQISLYKSCQFGFANYPHEYWHWSYGDRYWAYQKKQAVAIYGGV